MSAMGSEGGGLDRPRKRRIGWIALWTLRRGSSDRRWALMGVLRFMSIQLGMECRPVLAWHLTSKAAALQDASHEYRAWQTPKYWMHVAPLCKTLKAPKPFYKPYVHSVLCGTVATTPRRYSHAYIAFLNTLREGT